MKNKIIILILLVAITIPQVVSAAWWNPFTWRKAEIIQQTPDILQTNEAKEQEIILTNPSYQVIEKIVDKPIKKYIEKKILADNPELQKQINALLQENTDLKLKIASLITNLNACKASNVGSISSDGINESTTEEIYSDFDFKYTFNGSGGIYGLKIPDTSRSIVLKKAVFYTDDPRNVISISIGTNVFEKQGDSTFVYIGSGIPIRSAIDFTVHYGGTFGIGKIIPDFSKWEIWDNTTNKPVFIK